MIEEDIKNRVEEKNAPDAAVAGGNAPAARPAEQGENNQPKKGPLYRLVLAICRGNRKLAEILRFCIVGGVATIVDFVAMGITLYIFDPSLYPNFFNVFYGGGTPTVLASCVGTGVGFIVGLVVNYLLSVLFVFDEKGSSKTLRGFMVFALLSAGGLAINVVGMYLFVDLAGWNEWLIKIMLTLIVLVYNYITRKLIIFRKDKK